MHTYNFAFKHSLGLVPDMILGGTAGKDIKTPCSFSMQTRFTWCLIPIENPTQVSALNPEREESRHSCRELLLFLGFLHADSGNAERSTCSCTLTISQEQGLCAFPFR